MSTRNGTMRSVLVGVNGVPEYLGTIVATTAGVNQATTGSTFTIPKGSSIIVQTDAAVTVAAIVTSATTPPATTAAFDLASGDTRLFIMREELQFLSCRTTSGTANVKVFLSR